MEMLADMKEYAASTEEPFAHIINTFYARVEVRWAHLISTVDVIKRIKFAISGKNRQSNGDPHWPI